MSCLAQELEKIEKECETATTGNEKLSEEKTRLQRDLRSLEDRKGILQGSLDLERKRGEKHMSDIRGLKRQVRTT
jgi:small-conductance mechanosensitive channel